MTICTRLTATVLALLAASPAFAFFAPVPEPDVLTLFGVAAVIGVLAYRIKKRK